MVSFWPKSTFSDSGRKPWTIVRCFDQISLRTHNSSLEGVTKLNSAPLNMLFPTVPLFAKIKIFRFWPKTIPWTIVHGFDQIFQTVHYVSKTLIYRLSTTRTVGAMAYQPLACASAAVIQPGVEETIFCTQIPIPLMDSHEPICSRPCTTLTSMRQNSGS